MQSFLTAHAALVKGSLSGFDRIRFRGTLRWLSSVRGLGSWLCREYILLKDFKAYAMGLTDRVKQATQQLAERHEQRVRYLASSNIDKEDVARDIARRNGVSSGLVCVLSCVEPCRTFTVGPNRQARKLELRAVEGKCLHYYFYLIDRQFGWLNVRLQTWLPFSVKIVMNGREWLAQELIRRRISFERRGNCFVDIADLPRAQKLLERQLCINWSSQLDRLLRRVHPAHRSLFGKERLHHYWSADETEWATDVLFQSPTGLAALYPSLLRQAMTGFGCDDVLRFLGRRPCVQYFRSAELTSHLGRRCGGTRVKHSLDANSIKMYDKQESVLRVETTINNPRQMKVYRTREQDPDGPQSWQKLRKGVADLHRRAEISQKSNERYLDALAAVSAEPTLAQTAEKVCQRTTWKDRSVRPLNPLAPEDARLLEAVSRGEFALQGFRNRDLCQLLFDDQSQLSSRQRMAKVTRLIRLLRAHGLVHKVSKTHRYTLSPDGRKTISALLAARHANTRKLTEIAA